MKTVRIISGSYGADNGKRGVCVIDRGNTCEVDDAEAARLISLGVAAEVVATPQEPQDAPEAGVNTPDDEKAQEPLIGSLDPEQLSTMTNAQLKKLAEDMGLDTAKCRVKADYIELITAVEFAVDPEGDEDDADADGEADDEDADADDDAEVDDGEAPPDLNVEAPVE